MKVTIEVDIPEGRSKAEAEGIVRRYFDKDWISIWWHIDDVIDQHDRGFCGEITKDEARDVLGMVSQKHDCNIGINWDVIDYWIDRVKQWGEV